MIALRRFLSTWLPSPSAALDRPAPFAKPAHRPARRIGRLAALQVTRDDFLAGLKEVEPSATREFFIEKSTVHVRVARRARRGEATARRGGRAPCAHARRRVRPGRADAAARHPARRTVGNRQDRDGAGAVRREADTAHRHRRPAALFEVAGRIGEGAARGLQEGQARGAVPLFFDTIDAVAPRIAADHFGRRRLPAHSRASCCARSTICAT